MHESVDIVWILVNIQTSVVRAVNVRVLGKGLELLSANGGRFEINQLLFAGDTALVADSGEVVVIAVPQRVCPSKPASMRKSKQLAGECHRSTGLLMLYSPCLPGVTKKARSPSSCLLSRLRGV